MMFTCHSYMEESLGGQNLLKKKLSNFFLTFTQYKTGMKEKYHMIVTKNVTSQRY